MPEEDSILISRAGQQYGPYTLEQVKTCLSQGSLVPDDLAWDGKSPTWITLKELPSLRSGERQKRSVGKLILVGCGWWLAFMFLTGVLLVVLMSVLIAIFHPSDPRAFGEFVGGILGLPMVFGPPILAAVLTWRGSLPGTRR